MSGLIQKMTTGPLYNAITFVLPAVSDDETRYFMNGVFVERTAKKIILVATDGRRCHVATIRSDVGDHEHVPESGIWNVEKTKNGYVFTREIEGQFPNYKRVLPKLRKPVRTFATSKFSRKNLGTLSHQVCKFLVELRVILNLSFLFDICDGITYDVCTTEGDPAKDSKNGGYLSKGIRFDADTLGYHRTAVIMPMQASDD